MDPSTLKQAYGAMNPRAYGMRRLGDLSNQGFYEKTDDATPSIADIVSAGVNTDLGVDYTTGYKNTRSKGVYNLKDAGTEPNAWTHDAGDLGIEPVMVKDSKAGGLASLRSGEKDAGLLYASGKYWAENDSGKLEAIETDLINGKGSAREQAFAFMERKKQKVKDSPPTPAEAQEPTQTKDTEIGSWHVPDRDGGPLWGEGTKETPTAPPVTTQTPPSTRQMPSIPFGQIPTDFEGLKLPGGIYDTGRELAEKAGGWYGREKAKEKGGNLPFIGGLIQDYGETKGRQKGGEYFDQTAGRFKDLFQK